ncbi:hypothetical protein H4R21_005099 [Coemansia helicoidea]|uniref:Uncharacterized protein n=1 Tax=Coemansia helicoidea TaxID=1286919 RepID=A0ACC1KVN6_9FUNG|nr:hypothetical protein H4R21_005099 [Coemansia helicoidea]
MSSWVVVSVGVPVGLGLATSYAPLHPTAADWYRRLRKPRYNAPHNILLPALAVAYTAGGIGSYLVAGEMELARHTPELRAAQAGRLGLGFYWLGLTLAVLWPRLLAFGASPHLALADLAAAALLQLLAMIQFFRLTATGGLLMLLCFGVSAALATWNAALVLIRHDALPQWAGGDPARE